jgi:hypothetical protein
MQPSGSICTIAVFYIYVKILNNEGKLTNVRVLIAPLSKYVDYFEIRRSVVLPHHSGVTPGFADKKQTRQS